MSEAEEAPPLKSATQGVRDAAKYLIAALGAIGGILVAGLSFTSLAEAEHPLLAAVAVAFAVLALAILIGMGVAILTPVALTLGGLARLESEKPSSPIVTRMKADEELFVGQDADVRSFQARYVAALKARADSQENYLAAPGDETLKTATQVASARATFLDEAANHILETASFIRVEELFSRKRRAAMLVLAAFIVAMVGVYAWASSTPSTDAKESSSVAHERIWLEHLVATSGFRIEKLEAESEAAATTRVRRRVIRAVAKQREVQRNEQAAISSLAGGT